MSIPFDEMIADESENGAKLRRILINEMDQAERNSFDYMWEYRARREQLPPAGDWRVWMIMAGRGFGKTRAGAEWVRMIADDHPEARIALISSSLAEARAVMIEGESGLMAIVDPARRPVFEPSLHRVRFPNGAQAQLFSAAEPEGLRGPQHSHACWPSAEGILSQPSPQPARRTSRARGYGLRGGAAGCRTGRRLLQGGRPGHWLMDRSRRSHCSADGR